MYIKLANTKSYINKTLAYFYTKLITRTRIWEEGRKVKMTN